ncbi:MAG: hypothetical protein KC912_19895, partial [Proteobacteria bacterium]|nr:hypothetical protein [Pseudomonadota bacterium]
MAATHSHWCAVFTLLVAGCNQEGEFSGYAECEFDDGVVDEVEWHGVAECSRSDAAPNRNVRVVVGQGWGFVSARPEVQQVNISFHTQPSWDLSGLECTGNGGTRGRYECEAHTAYAPSGVTVEGTGRFEMDWRCGKVDEYTLP